MTQIPIFSSPFLLGFDQLERALDRVSKSSGNGYPPYNIEQDGEKSPLPWPGSPVMNSAWSSRGPN
jgi:hypothetical protein